MSSNYLLKIYFWEFLSMYPILLRGLILYFVDKNLYNAYFSISFLYNVSSTIDNIPTKFQFKSRTLTWDMNKNVMYLILVRATVYGVKHLQIFLFFWWFSRFFQCWISLTIEVIPTYLYLHIWIQKNI